MIVKHHVALLVKGRLAWHGIWVTDQNGHLIVQRLELYLGLHGRLLILLLRPTYVGVKRGHTPVETVIGGTQCASLHAL